MKLPSLQPVQHLQSRLLTTHTSANLLYLPPKPLAESLSIPNLPYSANQNRRRLRTLAATMPGFDFSNYNRNAALHARGVPLPKATSTGTTIVGCIYDNGVVVRRCYPQLLIHNTNILCHRLRQTQEPPADQSSPTRYVLSSAVAKHFH